MKKDYIHRTEFDCGRIAYYNLFSPKKQLYVFIFSPTFFYLLFLKKKLHIKVIKVLHTSFLLKKFTAKTVDEDPVSCQRWISRKEI